MLKPVPKIHVIRDIVAFPTRIVFVVIGTGLVIPPVVSGIYMVVVPVGEKDTILRIAKYVVPVSNIILTRSYR